VTRNDEDVNIEEDMQLVDAARRKPGLAETMVYDSPPSVHVRSPVPEDVAAREHARAAFRSRVWTFLDWNLILSQVGIDI
jgi:hypothetical protein